MSKTKLLTNRATFLWATSASLFWVIFIWGAWTKGVYALGFNATVFWLLMMGFFLYANRPVDLFSKKNLFWLLPFLAMALSFSLYQNPWLNTVTTGILPVFYAVFVNYSVLKDRESHPWNIYLVGGLFERLLRFLERLEDAGKSFFYFLFPANDRARSIVKRVLLGLFVLLIVSVAFVIPLLASADSVFSGMMEVAVEYLEGYISWEMVARVVVFVLMSVFFMSLFVAWTRPFELSLKNKEAKRDSIVAGIVLGGILVLYVLFLSIQLGYLWVDALPTDFSETESLVKNGFWQLFILSGLNVLLFFLYYRTTHRFVQSILVMFTLASLLLLLSAAQRMFLYVTYYGFSYEKFFAAYTVVYALLLFVALMVFLFRKRKVDIFKVLVVSFLWMYSFATVLPVEQIIFRSNVALSEVEGSRIELNELQMLSTDVLPLVGAQWDDATWSTQWGVWRSEQRTVRAEKRWYEWNMSLFLY